MAELAGRRDQLPLAVTNYLAAARATRDPGVAERATRVAMFAQDKDGSLTAAALWVALAPEALDARHIYAVLLLRAGRQDETLEQIVALSKLAEKSSGQGLNTVAELLAREKDKELAIKVMERLVSTQRDDPKALFALAHLLARAGEIALELERPRLARNLLALAMDREPQQHRFLKLLAMAEMASGRTERAVKILRAYTRRQADYQAHYLLGEYLSSLGRYQEAQKEFKQAQILMRNKPKKGIQ